VARNAAQGRHDEGRLEAIVNAAEVVASAGYAPRIIAADPATLIALLLLKQPGTDDYVGGAMKSVPSGLQRVAVAGLSGRLPARSRRARHPVQLAGARAELRGERGQDELEPGSLRGERRVRRRAAERRGQDRGVVRRLTEWRIRGASEQSDSRGHSLVRSATCPVGCTSLNPRLKGVK
jgi:hypothetical protein